MEEGLCFFVREDIPTKLLQDYKFPNEIEVFLIEVNLRKSKWLLCCAYNPHKNSIEKHLFEIGLSIDFFSNKYENFIILGDFNSEITETPVANFCATYSLTSLIKSKTCFKNPDNPSCIDLILTNRPFCFQNSSVYETGLSDFHKMTITIMKSNFQKQAPNVITYRDYRFFSNDSYRDDLSSELFRNNFQSSDIKSVKNIFLEVLQKHAPLKKKYVRANQGPFMNKILHKAVMERSRLLNKFRKSRSPLDRATYKKQRNYCVTLFRKEKSNETFVCRIAGKLNVQ